MARRALSRCSAEYLPLLRRLHHDAISAKAARIEVPPCGAVDSTPSPSSLKLHSDSHSKLVARIGNALQEDVDSRSHEIVGSDQHRELLIDHVKEEGYELDMSLYTRRHKFPAYRELLKLIGNGRIVEAMSRFELAASNWMPVHKGHLPPGNADFEISPHIIDDLIHNLARIAVSSPQEWIEVRQITSSTSAWYPRSLEGEDNMEVPRLALHALLDVYNIGGSLGIAPSTLASSAVLRALQVHADLTTFTRCMVMIFLRLSGHSFAEAQNLVTTSERVPVEKFDFTAFPSCVIRSVIEGYGRLGRPHIGETLARHWSARVATQEGEKANFSITKAWRNSKDAKTMTLRAPVDMNVSGWAADVGIWIALIKSRAHSHDLGGARLWLKRYREDGLAAVRSSPLRKDCGAPHVAYLHACSGARLAGMESDNKVGLEPDTWLGGGLPRYAVLLDVLKDLHKDGGLVPTDLAILLVNFQLGYRRLREAILMTKALLQRPSSEQVWRPSFYKALFHLHRLSHLSNSSAFADMVQEVASLDQRASGSRSRAFVADLRQLYCDFLTEENCQWNRWSHGTKVEALNEALHASLIMEDYPLAARVLATFKDRKVAVNHHTEMRILLCVSPSSRRLLKQQKRSSRHQSSVAVNLRKLLLSSHSDATPYEEHLVASRLPTSKDIDSNAALETFIAVVHARIVTLMRSSISATPDADQPNWLHEAWHRLGERRPICSNDDILQAALLPSTKSL